VWSRQVGAVETTFTCASDDFDEHGRIRMTLEVEPHDANNTIVPWQISGLEATIDGTVIGPAAPIDLDAATRPADDTASEPAERPRTEK
jgi:hypothetical protein